MRDLLTEAPLADLLCAVFTAFVVGTLFRAKIKKSQGWRFFVLWPITILATALVIYGLLIPTAWLVVGRASGSGVDASVFDLPFIFLVSGFTLSFPILYPLTIGTNFALRAVLKNDKA